MKIFCLKYPIRAVTAAVMLNCETENARVLLRKAKKDGLLISVKQGHDLWYILTEKGLKEFLKWRVEKCR